MLAPIAPVPATPRSALAASEKALRDTEARFRELADNISQFAWTADETGWIYWYNQRWFDYTGTTLDQMQGWGWQKVHHPDHVRRVVDRIRQSFETGEPWEDTFPLRGKDGTYRWFLSRALPIRDESGQVIRWFGTNTDVTEQIEAERELRELNETLEQRIQAEIRERSQIWKQAENKLREARHELAQVTRRTTLAAMTASIAHEINQPLAAIVTNGSVGLRRLKEAKPDLHEVRIALERIVEDGHRASEIIASLRAMFGKDAQQATPIDANELVRDVLALLHGELDTHHVGVYGELADDLPQIVGERVALQQVLLNLMMNAVEAMSAITDRTRVLSVRTVAKDAHGMLISVADSGPGIDAGDMRRIFEAFFTTKPQGMGMGLYICRPIVSWHGGKLWAEAGIPHGAVFHMQLPAGD